MYPAFQDRNWTARPWVVESEHLSSSNDSFEVEAHGHGTFDAASFRWTCRVRGEATGTITLDFSGTAEAPFLRNRLGLCVLHPVRGRAGTPVTVEHSDGSTETAEFPLGIAPHQPFRDLRGLTHEVAPGTTLSIRMEGEVFETEDHRNWSDASFKHYCTPIALPFPVEVVSGAQIDHRVTITLTGDASPPPRPALRIDVGRETVRLPALGVQLDHDGHRLGPQEVERLRRLRLSHLRIDLHPDDVDIRLPAALDDAAAVGAGLVVALVGVDPGQVAAYRDHPVIDRWLLFDPDAKVTDPGRVEQAQRVLGDRVGGGTDLYFTELNRGRPAGRGFVSFSANPQVHAWDDESVMQNAWTLGEIARQARSLYPEGFLELSPLTLRPRWNPNATAPELDVSSTPLPSRVDRRQCADFAAAWTVLALASITSSASLDAVTVFEATGWEGLMERASGSAQPDDFPSTPGACFPVYDALLLLAGATHAHPTTSTDPDVAQALALADGRILVANATAAPQRPTVGGVPVDIPPYGVAVIERSSHEG